MKRLLRIFNRALDAKRSSTASFFGWFWLSYGALAVWISTEDNATYFAIGIIGGLVWFAAADILRELEAQRHWREHNDTVIRKTLVGFVESIEEARAELSDEPSVHA